MRYSFNSVLSTNVSADESLSSYIPIIIGLVIILVICIFMAVFLSNKKKKTKKKTDCKPTTQNRTAQQLGGPQRTTVVRSASTKAKSDSVYSGFVPDPNKSRKEIEDDARRHSEAMHRVHQADVSRFDSSRPDPRFADGAPLTSVEKAFLKYIAGSPVSLPGIPVYWTYEYNINYQRLLSKFLLEGYLFLASPAETLEKLPVEKLKMILKATGLKVSGKKSELTDRIRNGIDAQTLDSFFADEERVYALTEKGKQTVETVKDSATKDTDLEDACLDDILNLRFNEAYLRLCENELKKKIPRGIMDWQREIITGLSRAQIQAYQSVLQDDSILVPDEISDPKYAKACVILGLMLGVSIDKTFKLFCRVTNNSYDNKTVIPFLQEIQIRLQSKQALENIDNLGAEEFVFICALDSLTCEVCGKMDGKHFPASKYKVGVTAPPMHEGCRCTTAPYFPDMANWESKRAARDENGKAVYVPADMTYEQWKRQYHKN